MLAGPLGLLRNLVALSWDVSPNIGSLILLEHPAFMLPVVRILLAEVVSDHLPRPLFIGVAKFPGEFGGFIGSHSLEFRPEDSCAGVMR